MESSKAEKLNALYQTYLTVKDQPDEEIIAYLYQKLTNAEKFTNKNIEKEKLKLDVIAEIYSSIKSNHDKKIDIVKDEITDKDIFQITDEYETNHKDIDIYLKGNHLVSSVKTIYNKTKDYNHDESLKLYLALNSTEFPTKTIADLTNYAINNDLTMDISSRFCQANDMLTIDLKSEIPQARKLINYINTNYNLTEHNNPFIPTYNGIGVTYNNAGNSYNTYVAETLTQYFKTTTYPTMEAYFMHMLDYAPDYSKEETLIDYANLNVFEKDYLSRRKELKRKIRNYDYYQNINLSSKPNLTEDDFSDMLSIADSNIYIYNRAKKDYNSSSKRYFK